MPSRKPAVARDLSIDLIRGIGILMIGVDHLAYLAERFGTANFVNPFFTWLRVGWSSAAEFFVFFSGYVVGLVYARTLNSHGLMVTWARAGQRAWRVYAMNVLTCCAVLALLHFEPFRSPRLDQISHMQAFMGEGGGNAFVAFLKMQFSPMYFEILYLYVPLLLIVPILLLTARVSSILVLLTSLTIWFMVQLNAAHGIGPAFADHGNFNPLGWQLIFVLGMLASLHQVFDRLAQAVSRRRLLTVSGALLLIAFTVKALDRADVALPLIGRFDMPGYDKANLGPLQLIHFLISVVFVQQVVPRGESVSKSLPLRLVARVGSRSLECFCFSTILVYAAVARLWLLDAMDPFSLLATGGVIVVLLCGFALMIDWLDSKPWRKPPPDGAETRELKLGHELPSGESR
ncbi:MAG TPA: OpgC domain-containing protein [Povalibacter sp.]